MSSVPKFMGVLSIVLQLAGMGVLCAIMAGESWRRVVALDNEQVSPTAIFKGLRVGSSSTCVTLHQVMNETGRWRTIETCNKLHKGEDNNLMYLRDAQNGQRLLVDPICDAERDWLAVKMGIPSRVDIVSVWDKQCGSYSSKVTALQITALTTISFAAMGTMFSMSWSSISWGWCPVLVMNVPAIPAACQVAATLISSDSTNAPSFEASSTLGLSVACACLLTCGWLLTVAVVLLAVWSGREEARRQDRPYQVFPKV